MKTLRQHEQMLERHHHSTPESRFRDGAFPLKAKCQWGVEEMSNGYARSRGPGALMMSAATFGFAVRFILHSKDRPKAEQVLELSLDRAMRHMAAFIKLAHDKVAEYRRSGWDFPQEIVANKFAYCRGVYAEWQQDSRPKTSRDGESETN